MLFDNYFLYRALNIFGDTHNFVWQSLIVTTLSKIHENNYNSFYKNSIEYNIATSINYEFKITHRVRI